MKARYVPVVAILALIAGTLLGYFIRPIISNAPAEEKVAETAKPAAKGKVPPLRHSIETNRPRPRMRNQDVRIAEAPEDASMQQMEPAEEASTNRVDNGERRRRHGPPSIAEMRAHIEEMKQNDPERYTQMTNNMARWRARQQERLQSQFDLLANADTANMTKDQKQVHEQYQDLLARQEELREMMNLENENVTDEQREAAFKEMHEISHQIHRLQNSERDTLLTQTANALGFTGEDAEEIVSSIKAVYEATGNTGRGHGPGGPGGPGGRGGPGGGRR